MAISKKSKLTTILRWVTGIFMLVFGVNAFFPIMPPPPLPEAAQAFFDAIMATGYLWYVIGLVKLATGLMLVANKYVPLAIVLLAPLSVNVLLFHLFLDVAGGMAALVLAVLNVYLAVAYMDDFKPLLKA